MFRISKLTDYGIVVMTQFALDPLTLHKPQELCDKTHIMLPTVTKILKILTRHQLLSSRRGKGGGYLLVKQPSDVSLADIIRAIEGDLGLTECSQAENLCVFEKLCATRSNWRLISHAILEALSQISLAEMAHPINPLHMNEHIMNFVKPQIERCEHE